MTVPFCSQMYHYSAHGLRILSELALPELYPLSPEQAQTRPLLTKDVSIELGRTPESLHNPSSEGVLYQAKPNQFLLKVDGIASYLVEEGKRITVQPAAQATEEEIRLFLLGSALGALLHQRGRLVLHGSAVQTQKGAVVFCGESGAGKSTLAAAFQKRGYPILADDVCVIELNKRAQPQVLPGLRRIKLWADASHQLGLPTDGLRRARPQLEKYSLPLSDPGPLEPTPLAAIYALSKADTDEFSRQTVTRQQKFTLLARNTYRQEYLQGLGMQTHHFQQIIGMGAGVAVQQITRPETPYRLDELVELLEKDFGSGVVIAGGAMMAGMAGSKVYLQSKRKREKPWTVAYEKLEKKRKKGQQRPSDGLVTALIKGKGGKIIPLGVRRSLAITPLGNDRRQEQLLEIANSAIANSAEEIEISKGREEEQEINRYLALSGTSLALNVAGALFYPPLTFIGVPLISYVVFNLLKNRLTKKILKGKSVGVSVIEFISPIAILGSGHYIVASFANSFLFFSEKPKITRKKV